MNVLGQASIDKLKRLDPRLCEVMMRVSTRSPFLWRVVQTDRTIAQQREYFRVGASKVNPDAYATPEALYKAAKHVVGPGMPYSRAVDIAIVGKDPYHVPSLAFLAGLVWSVSEELCIPVRWGGDFDQDGQLLEPGSFIDLPHFELAD